MSRWPDVEVNGDPSGRVYAAAMTGSGSGRFGLMVQWHREDGSRPCTEVLLSPTKARELAQHLLEYADAAEANGENTLPLFGALQRKVRR